jgi:hypothetical protein
MDYGNFGSGRKSRKEKISGNVVKPDKITDKLSTNYNIKIELIPLYYRNKLRKSTKGLITIDNSWLNKLILPKSKRTTISNVANQLKTFEVKIKLVPIKKHIPIDSENTMKFPAYSINVSEIPVDYLKANFTWSNIGSTESLSLNYVFDMNKVYQFIYDHIVRTSTVLDSPELFERMTKIAVNVISDDNSIVFDDEDDVELGQPIKNIHDTLLEIKNDIDDNNIRETLIDYVL